MELPDEGHVPPAATTASFGFSAKDEMNLAEFPIALVTDRVPEGEKTIRFQDRIFDERKGQLVTRKVLITASDEYGLPTAKDDEVILGLIQLTRRATTSPIVLSGLAAPNSSASSAGLTRARATGG